MCLASLRFRCRPALKLQLDSSKWWESAETLAFQESQTLDIYIVMADEVLRLVNCQTAEYESNRSLDGADKPPRSHWGHRGDGCGALTLGCGDSPPDRP